MISASGAPVRLHGVADEKNKCPALGCIQGCDRRSAVPRGSPRHGQRLQGRSEQGAAIRGAAGTCRCPSPPSKDPPSVHFISRGSDQIAKNFLVSPSSNTASFFGSSLTPCRVPRRWRGFFWRGLLGGTGGGRYRCSGRGAGRVLGAGVAPSPVEAHCRVPRRPLSLSSCPFCEQIHVRNVTKCPDFELPVELSTRVCVILSATQRPPLSRPADAGFFLAGAGVGVSGGGAGFPGGV